MDGKKGKPEGLTNDDEKASNIEDEKNTNRNTRRKEGGMITKSRDHVDRTPKKQEMDEELVSSEVVVKEKILQK